MTQRGQSGRATRRRVYVRWCCRLAMSVRYTAMGNAAYTTYTIGQLARAAGVPTSTVRYYERIGLLHPDARTAGNYRLYGEDALECLRFIRAAQRTGFTLEDITALLQLRDVTPELCQEVQVLIEARLS